MMNAIARDASPKRLLCGRILNLRKTRRSQNFFFKTADRTKMGAVAITTGLAGLGGTVTRLSGMALDTTEEVDLLEFDLDGRPARPLRRACFRVIPQ